MLHRLEKIVQDIEKSNLRELVYILGNKKEVFKRNLIAGIGRGIGTAIGFTVLAAIIIFVLQKVVLLNIPIIGEYITDIVEIVEKTRRN